MKVFIDQELMGQPYHGGPHGNLGERVEGVHVEELVASRHTDRQRHQPHQQQAAGNKAHQRHFPVLHLPQLLRLPDPQIGKDKAVVHRTVLQQQLAALTGRQCHRHNKAVMGHRSLGKRPVHRQPYQWTEITLAGVAAEGIEKK